MGDDLCNRFQFSVSQVLSRHKSILDILSKYQESCSRVNRAAIKSATSCGCIEILVKKQEIPEDINYEELNQYMSSHIKGELCDICADKLEKELGTHLFYLAALCQALGLSMDEAMSKELSNINTLGKYSLY